MCYVIRIVRADIFDPRNVDHVPVAIGRYHEARIKAEAACFDFDEIP